MEEKYQDKTRCIFVKGQHGYLTACGYRIAYNKFMRVCPYCEKPICNLCKVTEDAENERKAEVLKQEIKKELAVQDMMSKFGVSSGSSRFFSTMSERKEVIGIMTNLLQGIKACCDGKTAFAIEKTLEILQFIR